VTFWSWLIGFLIIFFILVIVVNSIMDVVNA